MINLITEDYNASITEHGNHILVKFNQKASIFLGLYALKK